MSKYIELSNDNVSILETGVTMVDFWAPWCGPCRMLAPVIDKLAEQYEGVANICKVNTDENTDLSVKYGIRGIPTVLFFKDGELVFTDVGAKSESFYKEKIDELIK